MFPCARAFLLTVHSTASPLPFASFSECSAVVLSSSSQLRRPPCRRRSPCPAASGPPLPSRFAWPAPALRAGALVPLSVGPRPRPAPSIPPSPARLLLWSRVAPVGRSLARRRRFGSPLVLRRCCLDSRIVRAPPSLSLTSFIYRGFL